MRLLLVAYAVIVAILTIDPCDRSVGVAENLPMVLRVALLAATERWTCFSTVAYLFMSVLMLMHTVGGHCISERVPLKWVPGVFTFANNHCERIAHPSVGVCTCAIAELADLFRLAAKRWATFLVAVLAICTVASAHESIEWLK